jgi:two-component system, NarL family, sensor histidine kinase UhpB
MSKHKESYNLLVVEDNKGDFILLRELLKRSALPVGVLQHSFSLSEVPTLLKEFNFDIAILDLSLPDSSGLDSVTTLSRLLPHTPIVVLSGLSTVEIAVEAIAMGVQDYLIKGEFDEKLNENASSEICRKVKSVLNL